MFCRCSICFNLGLTDFQNLGARVAQWVRSLDLTTHTSLSPIQHGFAPGFVNYKKGCTRLAATCEKVYQLLAQGRWFSPGTPASSTTKTGRQRYSWNIVESGVKTPKIKIKSLSELFKMHESKWDQLFLINIIISIRNDKIMIFH
jgi:hypothetical protein